MKTRLFLTLFLIFTVVVAGVTLLVQGSNILGKNIYETEEVQSEQVLFQEKLAQYVLNPIDFNVAKSALKVEQEEIDFYREYYGTLNAQIENVRSQYASLLEQENLAEADKAAYEAEMNKKLEEIRKNFESDEVVSQKILKLKETALAKYQKAYEASQQEFTKNLKYFGYEVTTDSGDTFSEVRSSKVIDTTSFTAENEWYVEGLTEIDLHKYLSGEPGLESDSYFVAINQSDIFVTGKLYTYDTIISKAGIVREAQTFDMRKLFFIGLWIIGAVAAVLLLTVARPTRYAFQWPTVEDWFRTWPIDLRIVVALCTGLLFMNWLGDYPHTLYWFVDRLVHAGNQVMLLLEEFVSAAFSFVLMSTCILTTLWLIASIREEGVSASNSLFVRTALAIQESFLNKSIGKQTMLMFIVFFLGGMGFAGALLAPWLFLLYAPLFMFVFLPTLFVYFKRMGYLNKVMKQTEAMAAGELTTAVDVQGNSPIARHAATLNDVRKGIELSVQERAKSERLKTELITNVSHDLRTPLTSIITYTDLLKNNALSVEEREKYVNIVDKKSQRLKTLIEDLFEVSKMASGNMEMTKQKIDLAQMLQQVVAEHEEDFKAAALDLRTTIETQPILAYVDGQKWWRVIDNLLTNARKYSLAGTRVYVTLKNVNGVSELTVKNVAKYELCENIEELTERFKRADESRHTEGSGLGLAIAQSIVDLHGGQLVLEVDGDLFKVTVKVNTL